MPGVVAEGAVSALPLTGTVGWGGIHVEGYTPPPGQELQVDHRTASTDYFRTMQIPLVAGRFFSDNDRLDTSQVVIIDEKFAKRFWPHNDAVGNTSGSILKSPSPSLAWWERSNNTASIPTAKSPRISPCSRT